MTGASPALPSNVVPLPEIVTVPQKVLLSSVALLPARLKVPATRVLICPYNSSFVTGRRTAPIPPQFTASV